MGDQLGVIGLGEMGEAIVRHWLSDGYDVHVFDVDREKIDRLAKDGAVPATSPKDLAESCDIALVIVGFGDQVEAVLFDDSGIKAGIDPGDIVIISSTVHPERCAEWVERLPDQVSLVDAPIARGKEIEDRNALTFVGGTESAAERVEPYLDAFSLDVAYLGETGTGQMGKAANNLLLWACHTANYETLRLAGTFGVDTDALRTALKQSSGNNYALHRWEKATGKWAEDDLRIIADLADEYDVGMPQTEVTRAAMETLDMDDIWNLRDAEY